MDESVPRDPGWNSGSMGEPPPNPIVAEALQAMKAYAGDIRRDRVLNILKHWSRFTDMTSKDVHAVLSQFPPPVRRNRRGI